MALQFKIDDLEAVDEQFHGLYEKADDGKYKLAVEGVDDVGPLKRAKEREKEARIAAEEKAREMAEKIADIEKKIKDGEYTAAKGKGDIEALEKSWQEKLEAKENELAGKLTEAQKALQTALISTATDDIASIFTAPKTQKAYIASRLQVEIADGKPVTRVLDENGQPTAMTIEEFKESLKNDPDLAPVIVGSAASGSGASGSGSGSAGSGKVNLSKASKEEKKAYIKRNLKSA